MSCVKNKVVVVIGCRELVHYDIVFRGQRVNQEFYLTGLGSLEEPVRNKRLELRREHLLLREDFDRELATLLEDTLRKQKSIVVPHQLYSSRLSKAYFFFFCSQQRNLV
jgi:hypothetical protein